jgi:peptide chain release factor 1
MRVDVFRSSGPGGQSVNTTDSAIRITHIPTGLVVTCQDEKSQLKNKNKAMNILRSRLYALEQERLSKERGDMRSGQIGKGDRSEKIRTYNFPQDRITDHRLNQNFSNMSKTLEGGIGEIITALREKDVEDKLIEMSKK